MAMQQADRKISGFTLIELSVVLVIIGLIVGGVLVGRDLVTTAAVRAQISQIEKYQQAVNTFRVKYGYLPGDIKDPEASNFGFAARGSLQGQGDGNTTIEGCQSAPTCSSIITGYQGAGEPQLFWMDLSTAKLIAENFKSGLCCTESFDPAIAQNNFSQWIPRAGLGNNSYLFVVSYSSKNYFYLSSLMSSSGWALNGVLGLTSKQASMIDAKLDDGLPQSGNILAKMVMWPGDIWVGSAGTSATPGSSTTCYDNGGIAGVQQYSITQNNGAGVNCALSFKFQ